MQPPAGVWAGGVLVAGLDFAFHDPFVIGHFHAVHLEIDHVDGFIGGAIDGGFGPVHLRHVIGIQDDGVSRIDSAYLDSPGRTLRSRRKEPRACARVALTPAATPTDPRGPSIEIYPI